MDYEKKLKLAKEALESGSYDKDTIEYIFPELKESKDERIKKVLVDYFKKYKEQEECGIETFFGIPTDNIIAWLEKQKVLSTEEDKQGKEYVLWCIKQAKKYAKDENEMGTCWLAEKWLEKLCEKKIDDKAKIEHLIPQKGIYYTCIKDYYSSDNTHLCVKGNIYKSSYNGYIDDESHFGLSWTNSCAEKYFEPTKDEDWIVCEYNNNVGRPIQYKEFKGEVIQKFIKYFKAQGFTPKLRLWTIQDAKDGDVLNSPTHNLIWIYKDNEHYHACVNMNYVTENVATDGLISIPNDACPATKDEQTILFARMKEAVYQWDAEKKELKKIEQKPA